MPSGHGPGMKLNLNVLILCIGRTVHRVLDLLGISLRWFMRGGGGCGAMWRAEASYFYWLGSWIDAVLHVR